MPWSGSRFSTSRLVLPDPAGPFAGAADRGGPRVLSAHAHRGSEQDARLDQQAHFREYLRCYLDPATRHAICEDYRAAATIDLDHDAADADRRIAAPLLALWGAKGTVGQLYDVLETWREKALDVRGRALDCGHTLQEEAPQETLRELLGFLA